MYKYNTKTEFLAPKLLALVVSSIPVAHCSLRYTSIDGTTTTTF